MGAVLALMQAVCYFMQSRCNYGSGRDGVVDFVSRSSAQDPDPESQLRECIAVKDVNYG